MIGLYGCFNFEQLVGSLVLSVVMHKEKKLLGCLAATTIKNVIAFPAIFLCKEKLAGRHSIASCTQWDCDQHANKRKRIIYSFVSDKCFTRNDRQILGHHWSAIIWFHVHENIGNLILRYWHHHLNKMSRFFFHIKPNGDSKEDIIQVTRHRLRWQGIDTQREAKFRMRVLCVILIASVCLLQCSEVRNTIGKVI